MKIADVDKMFIGGTPVERVYSGADLVWPTAPPISIAPINVHYADPDSIYIAGGQPAGWYCWGVLLPPSYNLSGTGGYDFDGFNGYDLPLSSSSPKAVYNGQHVVETIDGIKYQLFQPSPVGTSTGGYLLQIRGRPVSRTDYPDYSEWIRILWDGTSPPGEEPIVSDLLPQDITNYIPGG